MRGKKHAPVILVSIYIVFTVLLSYIGPKKYFDYDFLPVCIYMFLFLVCLWIGYLMRDRVRLVLKRPCFPAQGKKKRPGTDRIFIVSLHIVVCSMLLELFCLVFQLKLSLSLHEMGNNYIKLNTFLSEQGYTIGIAVRFFTGVFRNISLIMGFYYFPRWHWIYKCELAFYIFLLTIVNVVGYGTQKILGDILILFLVTCFINMLSWKQVKRIKVLFFCVLLGCACACVFAVMQGQRYAAIGVTAENYVLRSDGTNYYDLDHIVFKIFGPEFGFGIGAVLSYLSGGYFGLSMTFKLPFVWTYGLGSSYIVALLSEKFLGFSVFDRTYLGRLPELGRDGLSTWNTIFPWLASDFTFLGALLLFIFIGYFFAFVWYEVLECRNPVSMVMFGTLCIGFFYLPANNQLFHGIDTCIATVLTIVWWLWSHNRFNVSGDRDKV